MRLGAGCREFESPHSDQPFRKTAYSGGFSLFPLTFSNISPEGEKAENEILIVQHLEQMDELAYNVFAEALAPPAVGERFRAAFLF